MFPEHRRQYRLNIASHISVPENFLVSNPSQVRRNSFRVEQVNFIEFGSRLWSSIKIYTLSTIFSIANAQLSIFIINAALWNIAKLICSMQSYFSEYFVGRTKPRPFFISLLRDSFYPRWKLLRNRIRFSPAISHEVGERNFIPGDDSYKSVQRGA